MTFLSSSTGELAPSVSIVDISSFVPALVLERFGSQDFPPLLPERHPSPAAVLFADISGFTALAERLAEKGAEGTEELTSLLNDYFGLLIELISAHGGEVVKFAGDALLALWRGETTGLPELCLRATRCGEEVQKAMVAFAERAEVPLSLRIGIGAGEVQILYVGVAGGQWECVPSGDPLRQMSVAEHQAERGELVLSPQAWALMADRCEDEAREEGCMCIRRVLELASATPATTAIPVASKPLPSGLQAIVPFLQASIRERIFAGQAEWLSELRRITVLFVNLIGLDPAAPDHLERAQAAFGAVHEALAQQEGIINKLSVDDKGMVLLAALGLPPLAHADDPLRGVRTALAIQASLRAIGLGCAIGLTSGRVFCGVVGSDIRREYTVMGDPVNLAARLMQHAQDTILCDGATRDATADFFTFQEHEPLLLKGKAHRVPVWTPTGPSQGQRSLAGRIVGMKAEIHVIRDALGQLEEGQGQLLMIEGETGTGKTRLVLELHELTEKAHVRVLTGAADSLESGTPYYPWRKLVAGLLGLDELDPSDLATRQERVRSRAQGDPVLERLAPLLRDLVGVGLPDNELTAAMTGEVRAYNTQDLVVYLMVSCADKRPLVLLLEDAHWFDSASWALLRHVHGAITPLLLVLTTRPLPAPVPSEYLQLREAAASQHIALAPLNLDQTTELLRLRLGTPPAEDLSRQVFARAEGNPFFTDVLGLTLQESGMLEIRQDQLHLRPTEGDQALSLPDTIQGTILARIDRLNPHQQLMIKVASVIGRSFAYPLLRTIYPVETDRSEIPQRLQELERLDLTVQEAPEPDLVYMYRHETTREVAYGLLLYAQRRKLHRAVAEALEAASPQDHSALYPRLAWHWGMAEETEKHLFYLEKAGEQAVLEGAYREATRYLSEAIKRARPEEAQLRRAHWERLLGEACLGLGMLPESRAALERSASILGFPVPTSKLGLGVQLVSGLVRQLLNRMRTPRARSAAEKEILREAALTYLRVLETYFFLATTPETLNAALRALNIAEAAGPAPELARAYALFAWIVSMVPAFSISDLYLRLASALVERPEGKAAIQPVRFLTGFCRVAAGRWSEAHKALDEAVQIAERIGDKRRWIEAVCGWSTLVHYEGEYDRRVRMGAEVLYTSARRQGDLQAEAWGLMDQIESLLALGDQSRARMLLEKLERFLDQPIGRSERIWGYGLRAVGLLRDGRDEEARQSAILATQASTRTDPVAVYCFEGYAGAVEALTLLRERAGRGASETLRAETRAALKALKNYARVFPIARPRLLLFQGQIAALEGRNARALALLQRALRSAREIRMPYDEARALLEIGRLGALGSGERKESLAAAEILFERLNARWDLERLAAARSES